MVDELEPDNSDLDRGATVDRYRTIVVVLALIIIAGLTWYLGMTAKDSANNEATAKAQTFSLAQEVAAACASPEVTADLSELCRNAKNVTKDGPAGAAGPPGDQGEQGATGFPGKDGAPGLNGLPGAIGPIGPPNVNGTNGTNGATGSVGANGIDGTNGTNGTNGADGAKGADSTVPGQSAFPFTFSFVTDGTPGTYVCEMKDPPASPTNCTFAPAG